MTKELKILKNSLLTETLTVLKNNGRSEKDVLWIGAECGYFYWDRFAYLANESYDKGYGAAEVAQDLIIVGKDFWMERHEYDGAEWWEFKESPEQPKNFISPNSVFAKEIGWETLAECNGWEEDADKLFIGITLEEPNQIKGKLVINISL